MLWNSKGFSLIETLAACSIFFTIMFTLIPIVYQLKMDEHILAQRRLIQTDLFNELQTQISYPPSERQFNREINKTNVSLRFVMEEQLWKGCAVWTNTKNSKETFCLYGYPD